MQISAVSVSKNLKANVTETFWPQQQEKHSFSSLFAQTQSYKLAIHTGCKKREVWSDVRRKLIAWLFLLYLPGAVDKKSQENSWRYVDQRSEIVKRFMKTISSHVSHCTAVSHWNVPVVVSLDLSEVVRSANSNVPLDPDSNHQINAHTKRYSESG